MVAQRAGAVLGPSATKSRRALFSERRMFHASVGEGTERIVTSADLLKHRTTRTFRILQFFIVVCKGAHCAL